MKIYYIILLLFAIVITGCSTSSSFHKRKYLPGKYRPSREMPKNTSKQGTINDVQNEPQSRTSSKSSDTLSNIVTKRNDSFDVATKVVRPDSVTTSYIKSEGDQTRCTFHQKISAPANDELKKSSPLIVNHLKKISSNSFLKSTKKDPDLNANYGLWFLILFLLTIALAGTGTIVFLTVDWI